MQQDTAWQNTFYFDYNKSTVVGESAPTALWHTDHCYFTAAATAYIFQRASH